MSTLTRLHARWHGKWLVLVAGGCAIAALAVPSFALSPRLVWNLSSSAPRGIYFIEYGVWTRGDRVAVRPSAELSHKLAERGVLPEGNLLIKSVAAIEGDTVCRADEKVTINGRLAASAMTRDSRDRPLPQWSGCVTLTSHDIFLLGDTASSYDGRYFGLTRAAEIIAKVSLLVSP